MGYWEDQKAEARAIAANKAEKTTKPVTPTPPAAPSSATGGVGGDFSTVTTLAATPATGKLEPWGDVTGWDYTKEVSDRANELFQEKIRQDGVPKDDKVDYTLMAAAQEQAKREMDERKKDFLAGGIPVVNTDPRGTGAYLEFQAEHDPKALVQDIPGASLLPDPAQAFLGRNVAGPWKAFKRGIEESLDMPEVDDTPLYEQGEHVQYNEYEDSLQMDHLSKLGLSTFGATAAQAGYERWQEEGYDPEADPSLLNVDAWALPQLVHATYEGWGSREHLRKLERGHDIVSLRNELDLGRLIPHMQVPKAIIGTVADATLSPEGAEAAKDFADDWTPDDMTAAFTISLFDPDVFFGVGLVGKASQMAVASNKGQKVVKGVADMFTSAGAIIPDYWATATTLAKYGGDVTEALGKLEAISKATTTVGKLAKFDANTLYRDFIEGLPSGVREVVMVGTQAIMATQSNASATMLKLVRASQSAQTKLARHADTMMTEGAQAAQTAQAADHAYQTARTTGAGGLRALKSKASAYAKVLEFNVARTSKALTSAALKDLEQRQVALELLAQGAKKYGTPRQIHIAKAGVEQAYENMVNARGIMATQPSAQATEVFDAAAQAYHRASLEAVRATGGHASDILKTQIDDMRATEAVLEGEYQKSLKGLRKILPQGSPSRVSLEKKVRTHERTIENIAGGHKAADAHQAMLGATKAVLESLETGFKSLGNKSTDPASAVARGVAQQSLVTAEAMRFIGAGDPQRAVMYVTGMLKEFTQGATESRFGATTAEVVEGGKEVENSINLALRDMVGIAKEYGSRAAFGIIDYADSTLNVAGSRFNILGEYSLFKTAVPVLRSLASGTGGQGVALDSLAYMFTGRGVNVTGKDQASLHNALKNILTYGQKTVPDAFKATPKTAKGKANNAAERAAWRRNAETMTYDKFLLKMYEASSSIIHDKDLVAWARYKLTLVPGSKISTKVERMGLKEILEEGHEARRLQALGKPLEPAQKAAMASLPGLERAVARGTQGVVHAATTARVARHMALTAKASISAVRALKALGENRYDEAGAGYSEAAALLAELGMDVTSRKMSVAGEEIRAGVMAIVDPESGFYGFIPRPFINNMDKKLRRIVNSDELFHSTNTGLVLDMGSQAVRAFIRAEQTSMLTGLFAPNPRYYTNITIGNFTQMWGTGGIGFQVAAKITGDTLGSMAHTVPASLAEVPFDVAESALGMAQATARYAGTSIPGLPGVSNVLEKARGKMATKLGVSIDRVLPTITSAIMNPYVAAAFDTALAKNTDLIPDILGSTRKHTWGKVRNDMLRLGILQTFVDQSTLANVGARTASYDSLRRSGFIDNLTTLRDKWADMAEGIEQRQRIALYMELVYNKGMHPEEGAALVQKSLYDWAAPMTSLEAEWAVQMFMFWNFQRRAMGHAFRTLVSPVTEVGEKSFGGAAASGNAMFARMAGEKATSLAETREMLLAYKYAKEGARDNTNDRPEYMWWLKTQGQSAALTNFPASLELQTWMESRGIDVDTLGLTLPAPTKLEYMNLQLGMAQLTVKYAKDVLSTGSPTSPEAVETLGSGVESVGRGVAKFGGFATEDAMSGVVDAWFGPERTDYGSNYRLVKSPGDVIQYRAMDAIMHGFVNYGALGTAKSAIYGPQKTWASVHVPQEGGVWVPRGLIAAKAITPFLGIELSRAIDPAIYAGVEASGGEAEDFLRGIALWMGNTVGLGRTHAYEAEGMVAKDNKFKAREEKKRAKERAKFEREDVKSDFWGKVEGKTPSKTPSAGGGGSTSAGLDAWNKSQGK